MEKIRYEHIPDLENPDIWNIRFLSGDFVETVIQFGAVAFDENNDRFTYSFEVISSPDSELTPEDRGLQESAAEVLYDIITGGVMNDD